MFIETYIALVLLLALIGLLVLLADRLYQEERWCQRWEQRDEQRVREDDARVEFLGELYG